MNEERRKVLAPKNLLVFREMLEELGYDDVAVVDEMIQGGSLVGPVPVTDVLDAKLKPARISVSTLDELREQCNASVFARTISCGDEDLDLELWKKTMEEVEKGHLVGPLEPKDLPQGCFVNNRFPIRQADKVRPIDNYSSSLINDTVTVSEKPVVHSVDEIAAMAYRMGVLAEKRKFKKIFGKTADLKGAYRQLALAEESLRYSYVAVYCPVEKRAKVFHQVAVPFGSTKAVYYFWRVARALWTLIVRGITVASTNFFDDFVLLALERDCASSWESFNRLMKVLGWKLSDDKATDWAQKFEALGVAFDLERATSGFIKVDNTERRREELVKQLVDTTERGTLTQKEALQLRGRLHFAESQSFGRLGRHCLKLITSHAFSGAIGVQERLRIALLDFANLLRAEKPRVVGRISCRSFMILTDACFDPGAETKGGLGGVLLTGTGSAISFFSVPVSDKDCSLLAKKDEATVIYELEMLAVLIGFLVFKEFLMVNIGSDRETVAGIGVVSYIDNDAARYALVAGTAKKDVAGAIVRDLTVVETEHGLVPWFGRVGTESNIADEPSRFATERVKELGFADKSGLAVEVTGHFFFRLEGSLANEKEG